MERTLFIPGPTWVEPMAMHAMSRQMMPHRSEEFSQIIQSTQCQLRKLAGTQRPAYLATTSSSGMMEAAIRNLSHRGRKVLHCINGAFSARWADISQRCGREVIRYEEDWGKAICPERVREYLEKNSVDMVCLVHAETSTGVLSPLSSVAKVVREFDDVLLAVDAVSSYSMHEIKMDEWGVDVLLSGVQKGLALPPGLTVNIVSDRSLDRATQVEERGFYFDYLEYERQAQNNMTISTPAISLIAGLAYRMEEVEKEGVENRWLRHERLSQYVIRHMKGQGWSLFPNNEERTHGLTCLMPPNELIDTVSWAQHLKESTGMIVDSGYGKLKGKIIRISNMGIQNKHELDSLLGAIDYASLL